MWMNDDCLRAAVTDSRLSRRICRKAQCSKRGYSKSSGVPSKLTGWRLSILASYCCLLAAGPAFADPLASPSFSGPLKPNPNPITFDAGPFGSLNVSGQVSWLGIAQTNPIPLPWAKSPGSLFDLSNAQIEIQTTGTPLTFYVQSGAYAIPTLGTAYMRAIDTTRQLYGPVPVAYGKWAVTQNLSVQVGALPTLIGAEAPFTFQNMNIARGLLWNQEPTISRGVQVNFSDGPISASMSLNDGFYSDKYNWVSGTVSYTINPANTLAFVGGGNLSDTRKSTVATPLAQNNSSIYNFIYTYSEGPLSVSPYLQYSRVAQNRDIGIDRSAETYGVAILARYSFNDNFSLAGRAEYIKSSGGSCGAILACTPTNLLYGPGSGAWSLTLTPTYQQGVFFVRGEVSYTKIEDLTPGFGFGPRFDKKDQVRGMIETGVLF